MLKHRFLHVSVIIFVTLQFNTGTPGEPIKENYSNDVIISPFSVCWACFAVGGFEVAKSLAWGCLASADGGKGLDHEEELGGAD